MIHHLPSLHATVAFNDRYLVMYASYMMQQPAQQLLQPTENNKKSIHRLDVSLENRPPVNSHRLHTFDNHAKASWATSTVECVALGRYKPLRTIQAAL